MKILYKAISYAYLASILFIFVFYQNYIGVVLTTILFWLSVRGIVLKKFLMGASIPYVPVQGTGVRILSSATLILALIFYYLLLTTSALDLRLWAVGLVFVYIPSMMALGMFLKQKQQLSAPQIN
jgi:hypothetical protein